MEALSLYELNNLVRHRMEDAFVDEYWVQAELSDVRSNATGHCYLELVEKDERGGSLIARARAMIWSSVYRLLRPYFEQETGQAFVSGLKVLVRVTVGFHELYGYSLTIVDIDPSYTLGDMARCRREILRRLEEEGVLTMNKGLDMPLIPRRIAVISSATAAGYGDFCNQLAHNPYGYVFYPVLFPAMMQGDRTEETIISALNRIYEHQDFWDVVAIIRGGGAASDLSGFDSYLLAVNCAQFPLPVITGIGHERDNTVIDAVAHTCVNTPTAAAGYLIARMHDAYRALCEQKERLLQGVSMRFEYERQRLERDSSRLLLLFSGYRIREEKRLSGFDHRMRIALHACVMDRRHKIERLLQRIPFLLSSYMDNERHRIRLLERQIQDLSPERLLKRGYSITLKEGKALTDASQVRPGDRIVTRIFRGEIKSTVE